MTTETKVTHTSGPWTVSECSGLHEYIVSGPEWTVAELCGEREVAEANARLIAVAPELYSILRGLVYMMPSQAVSLRDPRYEAWARCMNAARDVLAKVDGE